VRVNDFTPKGREKGPRDSLNDPPKKKPRKKEERKKKEQNDIQNRTRKKASLIGTRIGIPGNEKGPGRTRRTYGWQANSIKGKRRGGEEI